MPSITHTPEVKTVSIVEEDVNDNSLSMLIASGLFFTGITLMRVGGAIGKVYHFESTFLGVFIIACILLGMLGFVIMGRCPVRKSVEYIGKRPSDEACPKCGTDGTIEEYIEKSVEHNVQRNDIMVNCMNTQCSYRCSKELYDVELRKQTLGKLYHQQQSSSTMSDPEIGLVRRMPHYDGKVDIAEEERRKELHRLRKENLGGKWTIHPEATRLVVEFAYCPECGNTIHFWRWQNQLQRGGAKSMVQDKLSVAECSRNCGYISKLLRHKRISREATRAIETHQDAGLELQSLIVS